MRSLLTLALVLCLAAPVVAFDLGSQGPAKPAADAPQNVPVPQRNGGDTILDAVAMGLPFSDTGSTVGFNDDYDEACPYTQSTSPDVVYTFSVPADTSTDIDMFGSTFDTKIYVYDQDLELVACNDDYYPDYVSKIENLALIGGVTYYLVIDGYGGDAGQYTLSIPYVDHWCILEPGPFMVFEDEPPLEDDYVDAYNGGCNTPEYDPRFTVLMAHEDFFGTSGWFIAGGDTQLRDTDWFLHQLGPDGTRTITADAEEETYLFELGPQDCDAVGILQTVIVGPCSEGSLTVTGAPWSTVWLWVGPTVFDGTGEYDYILRLEPDDVIATEAQSWSAVKGLFD